MINFCPKCGKELEGVFNYCPNCGFEITKFSEGERSSLNSSPIQIIICDNCGEENSSDLKVCNGCGAKLSGVKTIKESKPQIQASKKPAYNKPVKIQKTSNKKGDEQKVIRQESKSKKLDRTQVISIVVVSIAAVFLILLASGKFDCSEKTTTVVDNQNQQSGVNLQNIQKINQLEEQVKANPNNTELLLELAHLRNDSGFYEQAINDYQQYLKMKPANADARIDMGVCYYNLKQYDKAIAEMEKALENSPNHQIGHLNLGIVNLGAGNLDKSKEWLQKAININPNNDIGKRAQELLQSH